MTVAAVVLAAGASRRLGRPKQVLALDGATVLDATLTVARAAGVRAGRGRARRCRRQVRGEVDLTAWRWCENHDFGEGCATSIRTALGASARAGHRDRADAGRPATGRASRRAGARGTARADTPSASASTTTGWATRCGSIGDVRCAGGMHGDKAVWKLVDAEAEGADVVRVRIAGPVPRDVDTWDDYQAMLAEQP